MGSPLWLPIIFTVTILAFVLAIRYLRYRERMEMIRRGIVPSPADAGRPPSPRRNRLVTGAMAVGVGIALTLGLLTLGIGPWLIAGLIPLFAGLSMLLLHVLSKEA